eukprot:GHVL01032422.1.p1 GENE.GHVL01032422.1~~GHVL01032422.1.p1  ORF type:complete len:410 (+),score=43.05 GHVL01032422.1:13-1242(+)
MNFCYDVQVTPELRIHNDKDEETNRQKKSFRLFISDSSITPFTCPPLSARLKLCAPVIPRVAKDTVYLVASPSPLDDFLSDVVSDIDLVRLKIVKTERICEELLTKEYVTSSFAIIDQLESDIKRLSKRAERIRLMQELNAMLAIKETKRLHKCLNEARSLFTVDDGWVQVSNKHNIRTFYRITPPTESDFDPMVKMVRVSGVLNHSLDKVILMILDVDNHTLWLPNTSKSENLYRFGNSPFHAIVRYETHVPILNNRELVCERWMNIEPSGCKVETVFHSIPICIENSPSHWPTELCRKLCTPPLSKSLVRAECPIGGFFAKALGPNETEIVSVSLCDVKLPPIAPHWLINMLTRSLCTQTLLNLETAGCMKGKYFVFMENYTKSDLEELIKILVKMVEESTQTTMHD